MAAYEGRCIDADQHYYEPTDCFSAYIEPPFLDRAVSVQVSDGRHLISMGDLLLPFLPMWPDDSMPPPGSMSTDAELAEFAAGRSTEYEETGQEGFREINTVATRKAFMAAGNVDAVVLYPTVTVNLLAEMEAHPDAMWANLRAFNRWLRDAWGFDNEGIHGVPMLSLVDIDAATVELEWLLERGAKVVHINPGPVAGKSPADPAFDPFWSRLNEAKVPVVVHGAGSGAVDRLAPQWGEPNGLSGAEWSAFQHLLGMVDRPTSDFLAALVLHNLFGRFSNIRIGSIEYGSAWAPELLRLMDKHAAVAGRWPFGKPDDAPSAVFAEHVYISPFNDEDLRGLANLIGIERIMAGSDWPHPDGLVTTLDFATPLDGFTDQELELIMHDNAARFLGIGG